MRASGRLVANQRLTGALLGLTDPRGSRHEIDAWLDRDHVPGHERRVDTKWWLARHRSIPPRQDLAGIADSEADHMANAVREKQLDGPALDESVDVTAEQAEGN